MKINSIKELDRAIGDKYEKHINVYFRKGSVGEGTDGQIIIETENINNEYNKKRSWRWAIFLKPDETWKIK